MTGDVLGMPVDADDRLVTPIGAVLVVRGLDAGGTERDFILRAGGIRDTDAIGMHMAALARYLKAVTS